MRCKTLRVPHRSSFDSALLGHLQSHLWMLALSSNLQFPCVEASDIKALDLLLSYREYCIMCELSPSHISHIGSTLVTLLAYVVRSLLSRAFSRYFPGVR